MRAYIGGFGSSCATDARNNLTDNGRKLHRQSILFALSIASVPYQLKEGSKILPYSCLEVWLCGICGRVVSELDGLIDACRMLWRGGNLHWLQASAMLLTSANNGKDVPEKSNIRAETEDCLLGDMAEETLLFVCCFFCDGNFS